jgi:MFS family permease
MRLTFWREPAFWTFVCIRLAFWALTIVTLLWAPIRGDAIPPFATHEAHADLVFDALTQKDAQWFLHIAQFGYDSSQAPAFFPLFPLIVGGLGRVFGSYLVAGTLLSLLAAGIGAVLVAWIARVALGERLAQDSVLYLALYPVAFVFTSAYSEGLFLALSAGAFAAAMQRRSLLAGVLAALAVATRLIGIALVVPLVLLLWPRDRTWRELARPAVAALTVVPVALYALYLRSHRHDTLAFLHAHTERQRETPKLGPLAGLWDSVDFAAHGAAELVRHLPERLGAPAGYPVRDQYATWNVTHFLLLVAALWLTWYAWRRLGPAYGGYSAAILAIVLATPIEVFPLQGLPRFLVVDFPLFLALADVTRDRPRLRTTLLCTFAAAGALAAAAFAHDIWIA